MTIRIKVDSQNRITIPAGIRKELGIGPGDHLLITVREDQIYAMREPDDWVEYSSGLGREVWPGIDVEEYIRGERGPWEE